jgi:hypothetical protein
MPSNRPNLTRPHLTLDQQSFQDLLSAAFTIQEHNERRNQARPALAEPEPRSMPEDNTICPHCSARKPTGKSRCDNCHLDEFRPGERMQRNWASMWLMSQEQGLWPERSAELHEVTREEARKDIPQRDAGHRPLAVSASNSASSGFLAAYDRDIADQITIPTNGMQTKTDAVRNQAFVPSALDASPLNISSFDPSTTKNIWTPRATGDLSKEHSAREDADQGFEIFQLAANEDSSPAITPEHITPDLTADADKARTHSRLHRLADLRLTLRFHRADLYLGAAIGIAALALLWPAATSPRRPALGLWERTLIALDIADAPVPVVHLQGDPAIEVWVDTHTALYYCPGEEQYGKTADGRFSTQREAQMDRFEAAGRSACE